MKFFRLLHQSLCLSIPFRTGHPEVASDVFFHPPAFFVSQNRHRPSVKAGDAAKDGAVLIIKMISFLLEEIRENIFHEVFYMRSIRMACQKNPFSRLQVSSLIH